MPLLLMAGTGTVLQPAGNIAGTGQEATAAPAPWTWLQLCVPPTVHSFILVWPSICCEYFFIVVVRIFLHEIVLKTKLPESAQLLSKV